MKAEVEGTVASVNGTGSGFRVLEEWETRDGRGGKRYVAVWFPKTTSATVPNVGDTVKASGFVSAKVSERNPQYADLILNEARVEIVTRATVEPSGWDADSEPF